ncbi:hybrid sensor histidine kinase/response regulator transcription factor [Flavobacterium sp. HJJ]|uniref:hybrid sensor histidine kinase/response regulator transcription factor n=1 Tax=Flavobacterium sp. HJJ TaxID=2783792 RepID=UPI00188B33CD|nr:hybrid sensor histidine kinase/response regulator transcription factor [Flavobacterium sp. HJJ]MBF4473480.1 response regulator [Flavobacterium sp. HJJ]
MTDFFRIIITKRTVKTFLMTLALFLAFYGNAQQMLFSAVEGREQMNEAQIRNILQLKDGRIGVFTEGMLNLYDGSGFKTIHINDENTIPLPGYTGFHHSYLESDRIWFKNRGKLAVIDLSEERTDKQPAAVLKDLGIKEMPADLYIDSNEDIWILTKNNSLLCREKKTGKKITFIKNIALPDFNDQLFDVVCSGNSIYLLYKSGTLRCFDRKSKIERYNQALAPNIQGAFRDWAHVTAVKKCLFIIRAGNSKGQLIRFNTLTRKTDVILQVNDYWLNCFAANSKGEISLSCKKGLYQFPTSTDRPVLVKDIHISGGSKIQTEISTILYDKQGGFWLGTLNKGLYYYHPDRFRFKKLLKNNFKAEDSTDFVINTLEQSTDNTVIAGTNNAVYKIPFPFSANKTPFKLLQQGSNFLFKDPAGTVWIASAGGLYSIAEKTAKKVLDGSFNHITAAGNQSIYLSTAGQGVLEYQYKSKDKHIRKIASPKYVKQTAVWNNKLIGISSEGPFITDIKNNTFILPLRQGISRPAMFRHANHRYNFVFADSGNDLWMGTYDGLYMWRNNEQKLYQFNTSAGLVNNSVKAIAEDLDHSFWVTTSRGISHIFKTQNNSGCTFSIENYNSLAGVQQHAFAERSILLGSDGTLFAGGIDGLNYLMPAQKGNLPVLNPVLLYLTVFSNTQKSLPYNGLNLAYKNKITLKHNQNFFKISFSGLNYSNPEQVNYRYKLDNIDDRWRYGQPVNGLGEANYTNLEPGEYLFKVQSSPDGIYWKGAAKTLSISITPPFWKTLYAYIFYISFTIAVSLFIIFRIASASKIKQQQQQEQAVAKAKTDFITNISHELRTPLTLVITPLQALLNSVEDTDIKKKLQQISGSAQLMLETVSQLLEFKKMDLGGETLNLHFYESLTFINELCQGYSRLADEKRIVLKEDISQDIEGLFIDRQKVTRIIGNLISNALKFTPQGGTVWISVLHDPTAELLKIIVRDNGVGIAENELTNIFDRFYQANNQNESSAGSGIGLYMVKQYALIHRGSVTASSGYENGTSIEVTLSVAEENSENLNTFFPKTDVKTLLIAEDSKALREYLASELKPNFNIVLAQNGAEALENAEKYSPDLIICDMMMPLVGGPEFCRALRSNFNISHIPVIMLTGRTSDEARLEAYESGADAFLVKPFDISILNVRIIKLLQLCDSRRRAFKEEKDIKTETITSNPIDRELLDAALKHVYNNISKQGYSVEKFSSDMNMDRTGLYRKLMALTGLPPIAFIREIRLRKAAEMLASTQVPISDIAQEVGFSSVSYFTKCFHEAFNKTPSQYRAEKTT